MVHEDGRLVASYTDLYLARLSGRDILISSLLQQQPFRIIDFAASPQGDRVVFADGGVPFPLYLLNADGTGLAKVVEDGGTGLTWSPDGRRIALLHLTEAQPAPIPLKTLTVMNVDGSGRTALAPPSFLLGCLVWSPDGKDLAYCLRHTPDPESQVDTYGIHSSGGRAQLLRNGMKLVGWSPQGRRMLWQSWTMRQAGDRRLRYDGLWVSGAGVSDMRPLIPDHQTVPLAAWSPKSDTVAYLAFDPLAPEPAGLWVIDVEGDKPKQVASFSQGSRLAWTPDGLAILLLVGGDLWEVSLLGEKRKIMGDVSDFLVLGERVR